MIIVIVWWWWRLRRHPIPMCRWKRPPLQRMPSTWDCSSSPKAGYKPHLQLLLLLRLLLILHGSKMLTMLKFRWRTHWCSSTAPLLWTRITKRLKLLFTTKPVAMPAGEEGVIIFCYFAIASKLQTLILIEMLVVKKVRKLPKRSGELSKTITWNSVSFWVILTWPRFVLCLNSSSCRTRWALILVLLLQFLTWRYFTLRMILTYSYTLYSSLSE